MGFAASLHPLSLAGAARASALRTPQRIAVVDGSGTLTYSDLMTAARDKGPHASPVARWLAAELARDSGGESERHRALLLRALDNIVEHAAFDRDGASASCFPLDTEMGAVAATVSLLLGSTLHLVDFDGLALGICAGRFQTCWLHGGERSWKGLPRPAAAFRLALCVGTPSSGLVQWLGPERVAQAV